MNIKRISPLYNPHFNETDLGDASYFIAYVRNIHTEAIIESVAPCESLEGAWAWFKSYWRAGDGFEVEDVRPYLGGSVGNTTPL